MSVAQLTGNTESFNLYLVEGLIIPPVVDGSFDKAKVGYDEVLKDAVGFLTKNPNIRGDTNSARFTYPLVCAGRVSHEVYARIFSQAWFISHHEPARLDPSRSRLVLPWESVTWFPDGEVSVEFFVTSKVHKLTTFKVSGRWQGVDNELWQSFACIPGRQIALDQYTDIRGGKIVFDYRLTVQVTAVVADSPGEMVRWLRHNILKRSTRAKGAIVVE